MEYNVLYEYYSWKTTVKAYVTPRLNQIRSTANNGSPQRLAFGVDAYLLKNRLIAVAKVEK
ncbi:hypothetical protein [Iningainema tapete]|uniref:Uncharacterized protein n=1 Tax=Iningainema tapete BLCC-T55 TaxID=2748662 RepID=A0A8J6XU37_9CYAN|nr:hypothetical protein [Iningainema tapete]MBD2778504.1 hypothetical protein [Iningainema tapete BLCC-T55]